MKEYQTPIQYLYKVDTEPRDKNQHSSARITIREAERLFKMMIAIEKIERKRNLFIGDKLRLQTAKEAIRNALVLGDRLLPRDD